MQLFVSRRMLTSSVLVLLLSGSLAAQSAPSPSQVVIARGADILTGDPTVDAYSVQRTVFMNVCEPLVAFGRGGTLESRLAESWKVEDPKTFVFKLRSGMTFHDGTPVTAEDVKFTFDRILDPKTKSELAFDVEPFVASVESVDQLTVRINLKVPLPPFLNQMPYVFVISKRAFEKAGEKEFARKPVCSGAYRFAEWIPNDRVVLDAFQRYYRGLPKISRIIIRPIPEASTRVAALRAGEVDLVEGVPPDQMRLVQNNPNLKIEPAPSGRMLFFYMYAWDVPFKDKRVRQAMNYAVDWDTITKSVFGGFARRAPSPTLPHVFGYKPVARYFYDPARARQLLTEAGFPNGFSVTMETPSGRYFRDRDMAQAVAGYLQQVGVKVELRAYEWGEYLRRYRSKQVRLGLFGYYNVLRDFDDIGYHYDADRAGWYWNNPQLTQLLVAGRSTADQSRRKAIYSKALDLIMEEAPWIFGVEISGIYGINRRLDWKPTPGALTDDIELFGANIR